VVAFTREQRLARMREIGMIYDPDMEDRLAQYTWRVGVEGYVIATSLYEGEPYTVYAHWVVVGSAPRGMVTDHENTNKLDNRRENLRFVTYQRNRINNTSQHPLYQIEIRSGNYCVRVYRDGKNHYVGTYTTLEEAQEARDKWVASYDARQHSDRSNSIAEGDTDNADLG
jgi:hypothetical protein